MSYDIKSEEHIAYKIRRLKEIRPELAGCLDYFLEQMKDMKKQMKDMQEHIRDLQVLHKKEGSEYIWDGDN